MPRRRADYRTPREWLVSGEWPDGVFEEDAPDVVAHAVELARRLDAALEGKNKTDVAAQANLARPTVYDILAGNAWSDMITIARLETVLDVDLWTSKPPQLRRR